MSRAAAIALACYPPSWKERYGDELADLATADDGLDLLKGAARAWLRPAGARTTAQRRITAVSTTFVSWCVALVAALVYVQAVNDPPLPGLTTGASQPLWAVVKAAFFLGWLLVLLAGASLGLRIAAPAVRRRQWHVVRPMLPAVALLVLVLSTIPVLGRYNDSTAVVAGWLVLALALVVAGAVGPVLALRRSDLVLGRSMQAAAAAVALAAITLAAAAAVQAAVLTGHATPHDAVLMWSAVTVLLGAAGTSTASTRRALRPA